jgi:hypothetical protein
MAVTSSAAAAAGSASLPSSGLSAIPPACGTLVTDRSLESQTQTVEPSSTTVVSLCRPSIAIRPLPVPSAHTLMAPSSPELVGRPGIGRPRLFSIDTDPASAGMSSMLSTDSTSDSAATGGSAGGASPAPAGVASTTNPTTPAAVPAAANDNAVFLEFMSTPRL